MTNNSTIPTPTSWYVQPYENDVHVLPEQSSNEHRHVLERWCWCNPTIETNRAWFGVMVSHNTQSGDAP